MEFFKRYFHDTDFEDKGGEVKVLCPFHPDTSPSATVNVDRNLFHCWVCDKGYNEEQFMSVVKSIPIGRAMKLLGEMNNNANTDWEIAFKAELWADEEVLTATERLGFTRDYIEQMNLGMSYVADTKTLAIPVFFDGVLMDTRRYNVLKDRSIAKMTGNKGAKVGWIVPYDMWVKDTRTTYMFEGEKDMLMARMLGLNAITLTGGAGALPNEYCLPAFTGKDVVVCYDNDSAGTDGMARVCNAISTVAKSIGTIDISQVVKEEKEDFYDYIHKYEGDIFDFMSLDVTPYVPVVVAKEYTTIAKAMLNSTLEKELNSQVTVTSSFSDPYTVPTIIQGKKVSSTKDSDLMAIGETRYWTMEDNNVFELLSMAEVDAKAININRRAYELLKIPAKESGIDLAFKNKRNIYRCVIVDKDTDGNSVSLDLYSFELLSVGSQYDIKYRIYAHPNKHQRVVAIATETVPNNLIEDFHPDKAKLSLFKVGNSVDEIVHNLFQSARHHVAKHMDFNIWFMSDLVFNSILDFKYGDVMRGALDVFMLGDTQVGKSETTSKLVELYKFGHFLSLKTATTVGLVGGSNKVDGAWANTIGAIPRQHKKLVVLEEFSGAPMDFIKTMTVVRSANEVWITRGAGELKVPCKVRMMTISNPLNDNNGNPRFLSSFPNGVIPIMELIKSAEDVSRYDGFILTPKKEERFNPFGMELKGTPIPAEAYVHKSQWVYTRQPENVKFEEGVESYIWETAEKLNSKFECTVPIFGTTTSKKLARFAVALASLVVSTDETFENVIVTKDIVDYVADFLDKNYSSEQFKLDKVKAEWDSYNTYTKVDVEVLEELYPANSTMLEFLANQSRTTRANLQSISGKDRDGFSIVFNILVRHKFIKIDMENVFPSEKFRRVYPKINKVFGEMISKHSTASNDL